MSIDATHARLIDARPFLHPDSGSVWRRSNEARDAIYNKIIQISQDFGFDVLVTRSPDFVYPNWVSLQAWLPTETAGITHRVGLVMELHIVPHHRFDITYALKVSKNNREHVMKFMTSWDEAFLRECLGYLLKDGTEPKWKNRKIQDSHWEFWMPDNSLKLIRTTMFPIKPIGWILTLIGAFFFVIALQDRNWFTDDVAVWMYTRGLMYAKATYNDVPRIFAEYGLVFSIPGIALLIIAAKRKIYHMSSDRPDGQPRQLRTSDTWSTLLPRIGHQQDEARRRFMAALRTSAGDKRMIRLETISYVTPNGKREREQIVLSEGRAILFCHIYAYEEDLLIGWDAHLNFGEWAEKKLVEGIHRGLGKRVILNTVVPGSARLNEYDLIDLNGLTDWAHTNLVRIVKALMSENKLDDEIDFQIVRGERQSLLARQGEAPAKKSRFRREA